MECTQTIHLLSVEQPNTRVSPKFCYFRGRDWKVKEMTLNYEDHQCFGGPIIYKKQECLHRPAVSLLMRTCILLTLVKLPYQLNLFIRQVVKMSCWVCQQVIISLITDATGIIMQLVRLIATMSFYRLS